MNCSVGTCTRTPEVHEPLPLCGTCALRIMAAYTDVNLGAGSRTAQVRQIDAQTEIQALYRLLDTEGWNQVHLNRAMQVLNRPKATAAKRLAEARKQYAGELNRRAGSTRREAEIEAVYALIAKADDPKSVSLEDVMGQFGLKQTTAFDRLHSARKLWAER